MDKSKLINFISKYELPSAWSGRSDASVLWVSKEDGSLNCQFKTEDRSMMGKIRCKDISLPAGEYGVYETSKLGSLIKLMQDEFDVDIEEKNGIKYCLKFKDSSYKAQYILSNPEIIPEGPKNLNIPDVETKFEINTTFIDKYLKAFSALQCSLIGFTFNNGKIQLIINYSTDLNHNITIDIDSESNLVEPIIFDAVMLKDIFTANKDITKGIVELSDQGFMNLKFVSNDFVCQYIIVSRILN